MFPVPGLHRGGGVVITLRQRFMLLAQPNHELGILGRIGQPQRLSGRGQSDTIQIHRSGKRTTDLMQVDSDGDSLQEAREVVSCWNKQITWNSIMKLRTYTCGNKMRPEKDRLDRSRTTRKSSEANGEVTRESV